MDIGHILVGTVACLVVRSILTDVFGEENQMRSIFGRPPEMKDVDSTSLGGAVYEARGPYAVRK